MCTKKLLYKSGNKSNVTLKVKGTGEKLSSFQQICYTTNCVLAYANNKEISLSEAADELKAKGAFPKIYKAARKRLPLPAKKTIEKFL